MLHLKLTLMILFTNIVLMGMAPDYLLGWDTGLFEEDTQGNYQIGGEFANSSTSLLENKQSGDIGFFDIIGLLWDFIKFLLNLFLGSFIILFFLDGFYALIIGVPVVVAYGFAILGWVK